jgi:hypothetical protein
MRWSLPRKSNGKVREERRVRAACPGMLLSELAFLSSLCSRVGSGEKGSDRLPFPDPVLEAHLWCECRVYGGHLRDGAPTRAEEWQREGRDYVGRGKPLT